jgi:hypothetical protein
MKAELMQLKPPSPQYTRGGAKNEGRVDPGGADIILFHWTSKQSRQCI